MPKDNPLDHVTRVEVQAGFSLIRAIAGSIILLIGLAGCSENEVPPTGPVADLDSPAAPGSRVPRLTVAPDGTVWMSWITTQDDGMQLLQASALRDRAWSKPLEVTRGREWFVNWADFPSLLVGDEQFMAAQWLAKHPGGTYAYDVIMSVSADNGQTWSAPFSPHDDGTATEHGFVSLFPAGPGFGAVWLDGRNMAASSDTHASADSGHGHGPGGMTLRSALLDRDGTLREGTELDGLTCDCCQTGAAVTTAGPLVVYRDRDGDEGRDIYFSASREGRWTQETPVAEDGWQIAACPVNGPAIDAVGDTAVTSWFTAAPDPAVRAAFYSDATGNFGPPVEVDRDRPLGRVDSVLLTDGSAVISWVAALDEKRAVIRYRRIWPDGHRGTLNTLAEIPASRASGFPQMAPGGDGLVFAWTAPGESSRVITATAPVPTGR